MIPALLGPARGKRTAVDNEQLTSLALAARDGDPVAVERFIRAAHHDVWRFVARLSGDPSSADDLAQDTFLRALTGLPRFAGRSGARTWLLSIARRVVIDRYRTAAARPRIAAVEDWQAVAGGGGGARRRAGRRAAGAAARGGHRRAGGGGGARAR
ncbi:sigma-70 family RNA polymerase sigma factor, partial [Streptomyces sp. NPDC059152]|uniref:sigma-70 family RNA polymerase sigma factor n=1 Tax=Streptomyces sp. NPDC059152 TaxID=3346742 RepID=UPI00367991FC